MLKIMRKTSSSYYSYCSSSGTGMPCCFHSTGLVAPVTNYMALFHSHSSKPTKSQSQSQLGKLVRDPIPSRTKITTLEHALKVLDEMLHTRPRPSVSVSIKSWVNLPN
ncbi:hypothetical protein M0R45_015930 [Rubus argutus]|uniref:Uncharacterized protein n=1 Tax=Rubus argutus TaxID=59490 RepID=A0AAW1XTH7_RUBAR